MKERLFAFGAIMILLILACILGAAVMSAVQWAEDLRPATEPTTEPTSTAPPLILSTLEALLSTPTPLPDYHATLEALIGGTRIP